MQVIMPTSSSTLNPDAPLFIPTAYRTVEDFSDQWWSLIQSSPWFRDYWLRECFHDTQNDGVWADFDDDDDDDLGFVFYDGEDFSDQQEIRSDDSRELVKIGASNWGSGRVLGESRLVEKAPKIVKHKMSPRMIHQPR